MTVTTAEYIWLGGNNEFRSKTRTITLPEENWENPTLYEKWNYDGSSTYQADGNDSEIILKPCAIYSSRQIFVLCETYRPDGTPMPNNHRVYANEVFNRNLDAEPWYGIEQEYFIGFSNEIINFSIHHQVDI